MSAYKMISYHCRNCGGNTDPEKEYCDYCSGQLMLKRFINTSLTNKRKDVRLLIACGNDFINFDTITKIDSYSEEPPQIEITTLDDATPHYMVGRNTSHDLSCDFVVNDRTKDLFGKLKENKRYDIRVEFPYMDICYELGGYPVIQPLEVGGVNKQMIATLNIMQGTDLKYYDGIIPQNAYCPNCYAPVTSRYGCCDYCGGWVEWVW